MTPKVLRLMLIFFDAALVGIGKVKIMDSEPVLEGKVVLLESESVVSALALLVVRPVVTGRLLVVLEVEFPERLLELPEGAAFTIGKPFCAHFVIKSDKKERIRPTNFLMNTIT